MSSPTTDHIRSFPVHVPVFQVPLERIRLVVHIRDEKLADSEDEQDFELGPRQLLPDAAPRPTIKRAPCVVRRVQRVAFGNQPAFGDEVVGAGPVRRIMVHALMVAPDQTVLGRELPAGGSCQVEVGWTSAERGGGRV